MLLLNSRELESPVFACESSGHDVYDSMPHGYRCSRYARSAEMNISGPQLKFLAFLPSLVLTVEQLTKKRQRVVHFL